MNRVAKHNHLFQCSFFFLVVMLGYPWVALAGTISGTVTWRGAKDNSNVVVYLDGVPGEFIPSEEPHLMDQRGKIFIPHVLPILKEEKVAFLNSDPFLHNVHAYLGRGTLFNIAIMKSSKPKPRVKIFDQVGEHVILCDVHPEMEAWIIVLENPYFATTEENGSYKIENVPAGFYILKTWHKKLKSQSRKITVDGSVTVEVDLTLHRD